MNELIPEKYRDDEEIIRLTIAQLEKDLGSSCPEFHFSGQKSAMFDELAEQLAGMIRRIRKSNPTLLTAILYRIDVRESEAFGQSGPDPVKILAERIIQREFQKVLTRRFFSGKDR